MNILMISPGFPYPATNGGMVRISQIFEGLSRFHNITLITPIAKDKLNLVGKKSSGRSIIAVPIDSPRRFHQFFTAFSTWPYHVKLYYSKKFHREIENIIHTGNFSLIYCHFIYTLPYVSSAHIPIVVDTQNVDREYWNKKAGFYFRKRNLPKTIFSFVNLLKTVQFEKKYLNKTRAIISVSEEDSNATRKFIPNKNIQMIEAPNGVDLEKYHMNHTNPEKTPKSLVLGFLGSMDLELNNYAALELCEDILPPTQKSLPEMDVSALVIGRNPSRELINYARAIRTEKITITGSVEDILRFLRRVDILVLPLRSGAGTKLRVLEAMAAGVCIVGTNLAFIGIKGLVQGKHMFQANTLDDFVTKICYLAQNPKVRRSVAINANRLMNKEYSWIRISRLLSEQL